MSLFSIGLSGLNVARTALVTTAHNTANVYTEGYSRQHVVVVSSSAHPSASGFTGSGAQVVSVLRSYDSFLAAQLSQAESSAHALETYATQIGRIDDLLADSTSGLSMRLQAFFGGVQSVADTPADPAARQQMLSSAEALAGKFRSMDQHLRDLDASLNEQIVGSVDYVNAIATQVASLNQQISRLTAATGGQPPNDLLDARDQLVGDLSKLVGVTVVKQDGGQYNLFIGNGQTLVLGDRATTMTAVRTAADPSRYTLALVGASGRPIELQDRDVTGGSLGGLISFRTETLSQAQNALGQLAAVLASAFNGLHRAGVDLSGASGTDVFSLSAPRTYSNANNSGDLSLEANIVDAGMLTTSDYRVTVAGVSPAVTFSVVRLPEGQDVSVTLPDGTVAASFSSADFPVTFDGVSIDVAAGVSAKPGDSFLVQPTRHAASDFEVIIKDVAKIAAASAPVRTSTASSTATISAATTDSTYRGSALTDTVTLQFNAGSPDTLSISPASQPVTVVEADGTSHTYAAGVPFPYVSGASISFGGMTVSITGAPADLDTFTLEPRFSGVSDGSNALALAGLQRQALVNSGSATLNGAYAGLVSKVGNRAMEINIAHGSQSSLAQQVRASQQSVSGVNQDEETANLLMYQQMYQANAKVIQAASTIFDTILGLR